MSEPDLNPRRVFAARFTQLLTIAGLPHDRVAARAMRRRPTGETWSVTANRISAWKQGQNIPQRKQALDAVIRVLIESARGVADPRTLPSGLLEEKAWAKWWQAALKSPALSPKDVKPIETKHADVTHPSSATVPVARTVSECDPFQLGVNRAITPTMSKDQDLPQNLTPYLSRDHDQRLRRVLSDITCPVMVVLTGGSSTGKTRTAVEAIRACLPDWKLLHPIDSIELTSLVDSGSVQPYTVLWLNEVQIYLESDQSSATALRRLLSRADYPLVVLGTTWSRYWTELTREPSPGQVGTNEQSRELLRNAYQIEVPEVFESKYLAEDDLALRDKRLAFAAKASSGDGRLIQSLAGGPALVKRYTHANEPEDRYSRAVLSVAMSARQLGYRGLIPRSLLQNVAQDYLSPEDKADKPADWFSIGLKHATTRIHGISALRGCQEETSTGISLGYRLHDYLQQYSLMHRQHDYPPRLWTALISQTQDLEDRSRIAQIARIRHLYRCAVELEKPVAEAGDSRAMLNLAEDYSRAELTTKSRAWLRKAADIGNTDAMVLLAQAATDDTEKQNWLQLAADAGSAEAMFALAERARAAGDTELAHSCLRRAADLGHDQAIRELIKDELAGGNSEAAYCLLEPKKREINVKVNTYQRGCGVGNREMTELADLLEEVGRLEESEYWHRKAAEIQATDSHAGLIAFLARNGRIGEVEAQLGRISKLHDRLDFSFMVPAVFVAIVWLRDGGHDLEADELLTALVESGEGIAVGELLKRWLEMGRLSEAERWLTDEAESGSVDLRSTRMILEALRAAGRQEDADRFLHKAVIGRWFDETDLATILEAAGHYDEAESALRRDYRSNSRNYRQLVAFLNRHGKFVELENVLRDVSESGSLQAMLKLIEFLYAANRNNEAEPWVTRAFAHSELSEHDHISILWKRGDFRDLELIYRKRIEESLAPLDDLAMLLRHTHRTEEAERLMRFGVEPDGQTGTRL